MKNLVSLLMLFLSSPSFAVTCPVDNPQLSMWRSQQNWVEQLVVPSSENPHLVYKVFETEIGELKLGSLEQGIQSFNAQLEMKFSSVEKEQKFKKRCKSHKIISVLDDKGDGVAEREGYFKVTLSLLPKLGVEVMTPVFQNSSTFEASLWLAEDSRSKLSSFPAAAIETQELLEKSLERRVNNKITTENGFNGEVELNIDGNSALACDLVTGKAKVRFYHKGELDTGILSRKDTSTTEELRELSNKVTSATANPDTNSVVLFTAGFVAQEAKSLGLLESDVQTLKPALVNLFNKDYEQVRVLDEENFNCALDLTAEIFGQSDRFENVFEVEISNKKEVLK